MSYLAMSAETIQQNDTNSTVGQRKRSSNGNNKTQKFRSDFDFQKVNSVLESIHNKKTPEDESELGAFSLLQGQGQRKENMSSMIPQPVENENIELQNLNQAHMNESQVRDYYNKLGYRQSDFSKQGDFHRQSSTNNYNQSDPMMDKLNYIINLLEEQQDQKTDSVTEEVILYSFLGVFIIFVVDSFTKVGKYVR